MVIADFSGNYTNADNCKEGDIGLVITEGKYETKENFKGEEYEQLSIDVEVSSKKLVHSPRIAEGKKLVAAWGKDTKAWVGKRFKCHVVNYKAMGQTKQCIEIEPVEEKVKAK